MKNSKICLVTGANSGIGKEIALGLAKSGAHVVMVCRDLKKGKTTLEEIKANTSSDTIDLLIADLSSQTEVHLLAKTIYERYPKLDVLINNAGLVLTKKSFSIDGIEMTFATNYLSPFLLTYLLTDLLKKSTPARIINISSAIHKWAKIDLSDLQFERRKYHFMKAYAQSKLLLNIFTFDLAERLKNTGISVNCVHPGAVKTALGSNNANNLIFKFIDKAIKFFFITPKQAAANILDLALAPQLENVSGKYFIKGKSITASPLSYDARLANKIWELSEMLIGLKECLNESL